MTKQKVNTILLSFIEESPIDLNLIDTTIAELYRGSGTNVQDRKTTLLVNNCALNDISKQIEFHAHIRNNKEKLGFVFTSYRFPNGGLVTFSRCEDFFNDIENEKISRILIFPTL